VTTQTATAGDSAPAHRTRTEETVAGRFFWTVLILATLASIGGNVTHALLKANSGPLVAVAAAVAMVVGIRRYQNTPNRYPATGVAVLAHKSPSGF